MADEFNELYNALFNKADRYIAIVKFLSTKREGFIREEIEKGTGYLSLNKTTCRKAHKLIWSSNGRIKSSI